MANQEPLRAKLTTAGKNDVTGVTERWDFAVPMRGLVAACTIALRAAHGPGDSQSSHVKPKQGLNLRRRGFITVGEAIASDLSDLRLCNGAVHRADADRRRQNGDDASDEQPSRTICHNTLHTRSIRRKGAPVANRYRGAWRSHLTPAAEAAGPAISQVFLTVRTCGSRNGCERGKGQSEGQDELGHESLL